MSRLIDADLLEPDADYDDGEYWAVSMAQIQSAPTVTPERKRGEWIFIGDGYKCSKCRSVYSWWADSQTSNFCQNCGAEMRGGQNEAD